MTDTIEMEAAALAELYKVTVNQAIDYYRPNVVRAIGAYAEAVRATEREKVRALVGRLAGKEGPIIAYDNVRGISRCCFCDGFGDYTLPEDEYIDHAEDCLWIEARLWLANDILEHAEVEAPVSAQ
jgi:hypothetical protein